MDLSDLIARPEEGATPSVGDPGTATSDTAAGVAARSEASHGGPPILALVVGGVGLLLALVAAIALLGRRRDRRRRLERMEAEAQARAEAAGRAPREPVAAPAPVAPVPAPAPVVAAAPAATEPKICPTCRRGQPPSVAACPHDGTPLVTYAEFAARSAAPEAGGSVCPVCGTRYPATTRFCGKDGTTLGPS